MSVNLEKHRRMKLRKATGTRVINSPEPVPFHRGPEYLVAHVCFNCRKSYKRPVEYSGKKATRCHPCPGCGECMHEMGRSFKAPKAVDKRQWRKVQILFAAGFRFISCGSHEGAKLPAELSELEGFLINNQVHPLKVAAPNKLMLPDGYRDAATAAS
ncbi:hypothetical protein ACJJIG_16520 [Microbulbifer sp. SSSA007]|uniref:hypothetical protein n=1 Tax=Microbulbifer sp. SSSA007 TaxID=3243379 RepID=UPI004039941F